jgi:hypothetical protein
MLGIPNDGRKHDDYGVTVANRIMMETYNLQVYFIPYAVN